MTKRKITKKSVWKNYPDEYNVQAVKLADTAWATVAAKQFGIHTSQIYGWRGSQRKKESVSEAAMKDVGGQDVGGHKIIS